MSTLIGLGEQFTQVMCLTCTLRWTEDATTRVFTFS